MLWLPWHSGLRFLDCMLIVEGGQRKRWCYKVKHTPAGGTTSLGMPGGLRGHTGSCMTSSNDRHVPNTYDSIKKKMSAKTSLFFILSKFFLLLPTHYPSWLFFSTISKYVLIVTLYTSLKSTKYHICTQILTFKAEYLTWTQSTTLFEETATEKKTKNM